LGFLATFLEYSIHHREEAGTGILALAFLASFLEFYIIERRMEDRYFCNLGKHFLSISP
jgi:hypothetical protein